jgi:uncharacterized membrane protein
MDRAESRPWWRILWDDAPLLNFAFYAVMIAQAEVNNLTTPRPELFLSCLFPMTVPVVIYFLRWGSASDLERRVSVGVIAGSAVCLLLIRTFIQPVPVEAASLRSIYEVSAILNAVLLGVHAWRRGRGVFAMFFGPAALYGVLLENGGILLGYFSELDYRLYLGPLPAPLATMCGWLTVFYIVTWVAWALGREVAAIGQRPLLIALAAMTAALLLDLQIDPLATAVGFWAWHPLLPRTIMDVPILNFAAWGCAVLPFAFTLFWRQHRHGLSAEALCERRHILWLTAMVPLVLAAATMLFALTMMIIDGGLHGPTAAVLRQTLLRWGWVRPDVTWTPGGP